MHRLSGEDPAHVRPPRTVDRRMGIAFAIGELVMDAVRRYPENRTAIESQRGKNGERVFQPARNFVATVGQQAVIAHADSQAGGHPPKNGGDDERFPRKEKQRGNRADMKQSHENRGDPVHFRFCFLLLLQYFERRNHALCGRLIRNRISHWVHGALSLDSYGAHSPTRLAAGANVLCNRFVIPQILYPNELPAPSLPLARRCESVGWPPMG